MIRDSKPYSRIGRIYESMSLLRHGLVRPALPWKPADSREYAALLADLILSFIKSVDAFDVMYLVIPR